MYKVIKEFKDKDGKKYKIGDSYENEDEKRLEILSTNENRYGYPFIQKVDKRKTRNKKEEV